MDGNFRSAINGFHRQDVVNYITETARNTNAIKAERDALETQVSEQAQELERLNSELEAARSEADQLREERSSLQQRLSETEAQLDSCRALLPQDEEELELLKMEAEERSRQKAEPDSAELKALRAENQRLTEQLKISLEKSNEYDLLKERMLTLELNASRRAVEIEAEAKEQASSLIDTASARAAALEESRAATLETYRSKFSDLSSSASTIINEIDGKLDDLRTQLLSIAEEVSTSARLFGEETKK